MPNTTIFYHRVGGTQYFITVGGKKEMQPTFDSTTSSGCTTYSQTTVN